MIDKPTISVVLPVYNGEKFLADAIESVLAQTFEDFELIIINDGSKDSSLSIIKHYMIQDKRVKLIDRENKGLVYSLNEGISQARGSFIARMDADDICLPTRFEDQLNYMQQHNIDLCGSWIQPFTENKILPIRKYPEKHADITITMIFFNCFAHPSMMIKRKVFDHIQYEQEAAEDYLLWCNAISMQFNLGNIPKVLLKYREHPGQITKSLNNNLNSSAENIAQKLASNLGINEQALESDVRSFLKDKNRGKYITIAKNLKHLIRQYNASSDLQATLLLWLYSKAQPKSPYLYLKYRYCTLGCKKTDTNELTNFLKSFLYLDEGSQILNKIRRIYHKYN